MPVNRPVESELPVKPLFGSNYTFNPHTNSSISTDCLEGLLFIAKICLCSWERIVIVGRGTWDVEFGPWTLDARFVTIQNDVLLDTDYSIRRLFHHSQQHSNSFAIWPDATNKCYDQQFLWTLYSAIYMQIPVGPTTFT